MLDPLRYFHYTPAKKKRLLIKKYNETDLAKVAESMGAFGIRVEKPSEIISTLDQALSADRPAVVDVATEVTAMAPPAIG